MHQRNNCVVLPKFTSIGNTFGPRLNSGKPKKGEEKKSARTPNAYTLSWPFYFYAWFFFLYLVRSFTLFALEDVLNIALNVANRTRKKKFFSENEKGAKTIYVLIISCSKGEFKNGSVGVWCIMVKRTNAYKKARVDDIEWVCATSERDRERNREMVERKKNSSNRKRQAKEWYIASWRMIWFFLHSGKQGLLIYFPYLLATITIYMVGPDRWVECFLRIGQTNFNLIHMNITVCDVRWDCCF